MKKMHYIILIFVLLSVSLIYFMYRSKITTELYVSAYNKICNTRSLDFEGAKLRCNMAIIFSPNFSDTYSLRGVSRYMLKNYQGAINDYTKAINLKTHHKIIRTAVGQPIDFDFYNRGSSKFMIDNFEGAIEDYTKAIEILKGMRDTKIGSVHPIENYYSYRGNARIKLGHFGDAIEDYTKAINFASDRSTKSAIHSKRGFAKDKIGDSIGAIADYDTAKILNPNNSISALEAISYTSVLVEKLIYLGHLEFIKKK